MRFREPGCSSRRDNIVRALRFIQIFYNLTPKRVAVTDRRIQEVLECSPTNARLWRDVASLELPITDEGYTNEGRRGPPAKLYGVMQN